MTTLALSFLKGYYLLLQVTKKSITSRTSSKFGKIGLRTAELAALSVWKNLDKLIMGKML